METNINYTAVGIFIITLLGCIILGIIWLSSGLTGAHYKTYKVYMQESVTGLTSDSIVAYNGVEVGNVQNIEINKRNPHLVELLLNIKDGTPITNGTRAKLASKSMISGVSYISLQDKGTDMTPLIKLPGQPYPVIRTEPSLFMQWDTALTQLSNSFREITASIKGLLDQENLHALKQTFRNIREITDTISADRQQIGVFINSSSKAVRTFETQTLPDANQAIQNLNNMTRSLSDAATDIKRNPAILLRGKAPATPGPGE